MGKMQGGVLTLVPTQTDLPILHRSPSLSLIPSLQEDK